MTKVEEKMTPVAANDAAAGGGEGAKKKKKRVRKKKSKNNKGGDDAKSTASSDDDILQPTTAASRSVAPSGAAATAAAVMNPHTILRNRLMDEGFSSRQVDRAMEEMWDKNLAYDEFDAVLKYLKGENETKTEESNEDASSGTPKESAEKNTPASRSGAEESKETESEVPPAPVAAKSNLKPAPSMTMEQKLETVAGFENMTDAIFALTEWVSKAAKPRDLEDLCATTKTMALVTIFRRSITESKDQQHFNRSVLPSMVRLMESLLGESGISSAAVTETQRAFEQLLKQARNVYLLQQPDAQDFSERVSSFIVSRISLAIGESNATATNEKESVPAKLSAPVSVSGSKMEDKGIAELLSKREINLTAAKRYGVSARSACASLTSGGGGLLVGVNGGPRETEIGKSDIMLALVGEDAKAAFDLQKADLEELKLQAKQKESETMQELRTSIEEINEERKTIQQRIAELKQSIEKLETYDAELCVKVGDAQSELDGELAQASVEATTLNDKINQGTDAIKYVESVLGLVDLLKDYDDSLDNAISVQSKATTIPDMDPAEFAYRQMEVYLSRVRTYFQCEADTADFLRKRIETSTKAVGELKIEIIECEGLGMNTTIGQMKESIKTKESLILKDSAMLQRFTLEAASVFETFIVRLGEYKSVQLSSSKLGAIQSDILRDVRSCSSRLGVPSVDRLDPFMTPMNGGGYTMAPVGSSSIGGTTLVPSNTAVSSNVTIAVEKPQAMPKLSWAAAKAPSSGGTKTSLLDIQNEELQSKGA